MKKKHLFLLLFLVATMTIFSLDYTIELVDSYGDGWDGYVTVSVNGSPILEDITLSSGAGPQSHSFTVEQGDFIEADYTSTGYWSTENEYQIKNESGEVVAQSGQGGVTPGDVNYTVPAVIPGTPDAPVLESPADGATAVATDGNLEWTIGENTNTATLYLADNAEFTDAIITEENATSPYNYSGLETGTLYYWKVVAVGPTTIEVESNVNSFTTPFEAISEFPYEQGFEMWPPTGWVLNPESGTGTWLQDDGTDHGPGVDNIYAGTYAAMFNNYDYSNGTTGSMETPELDLSGMTAPLVKFYWWNNDGSSSPAHLKVYTKELEGEWLLVEDIEVYGSGTTTWIESSNLINVDVRFVKLEAVSDYGMKNTYVDGFIIEEAPADPIATLSDTELDFGTVNVGETGSDLVSISNTGAGTLNITDIAISGTNAGDFAYQTDTEGPWALTTGQELVIQVDFTPTAEGARSASLDITDDLGSKSRQVSSVTLTGEGFVMPAGNHHNDPIVLTLADEIIETGSTTNYDTYYDFCSSQSVVYQLTLPSEKLLSISLEGTAWDTKLYVFNSYQQIDEATSSNDAWYYNDDESSAGQGGAKSKSRDRATWSEMLETLSPAGDYYIIVTGYEANNGDYTLTINAIDMPIPSPATSPSPADDAVDQPLALTLEWTNPEYTETIDLYFGTPGSKSLTKLLDNVEAVEEHEVTDLATNTEYNWYVVCKNSSGPTLPENIETWSFTTIGNPPLGTSYTSPADNAPEIALSGNLSWQAADNADGYKVYLSEDNAFAGITPVDQEGTTYPYIGLDYETTYYWKVVPYNVVGDATEGIEIWSFTTIPDPTIAMPVSLNFEGSTTVPSSYITSHNMLVTNSHGNESNVLYKNVYTVATSAFAQFQSMNNITENSVINFDYRLVNFSSLSATAFMAEHDYFVAKVSTDNGVSFTAIDQINSLNHTSTQDMTNYTIDIGAYAGQTAIFRFEMEWVGPDADDDHDDYYFDIDNIFFGNAPEVTIPAGGSPTDPFVFNDENVELEFTNPNPAGFSLQIFMRPSLPTNDNGLPETMDSFLPRTWRVESSVEDPGSYIITFDLAGLGITNYGLVRFFKRADGSEDWVDVINLGASLSWNGSKVTISGLDTFSEFVPGIDETLPVTLASFNAVQTSNKFAQINWVTASESEVLGYNLFRGENDNQDQALRVTATMIEASNSPTGASYSFTDDEVEMNSSYYYWLQTVDFDGSSEMFGPVTIKISEENDYDIGEVLLGTQLIGNYPNPFNPSTTISFSVAQPQVVTIDVYNIKGQLVKRVFNGKVETPNIKQNVVWNGKDSDNKDVASGIYFTLMKSGNKTFTNKAILMK